MIFIITLAFIVGSLTTLIFIDKKVVKNISESKNNVHFYVARDKDGGKICLYLGKPRRYYGYFIPRMNGIFVGSKPRFHEFGLNPTDFKDLKWEDDPVEVFIKMKD